MGKGEVKRGKIFNKYSAQLNNLVRLRLYDSELLFEKTYLCPICLLPFSEESLDVSKDIFLTLEDAPPKSLGGKANTLTCKKCNNESGYKIDFHLLEALKEQGIRTFSPNSGSKLFVTHKGIEVQGILKVDTEGEISFIIKPENNEPKRFAEYVSRVGKDDNVEIRFPASRVEVKNFEVALLKTAYILAFEKFGYPLILSKAFDIVRDQLKKPTEDIYPSGFWTMQKPFSGDNIGVHLIITQEFEGFHAIFNLKTGSSEYGFVVYLPTSQKTTKSVIEKLRIQQAGFTLSYDSYKNTDYFEYQENQKMMTDFMRKRNEI